MSNIEDQIVQMQFDNKQFESGVNTSLGTIDKLNQSLQFKNGVNGIGEINRAASGMNLNPIAAGIQGINKAWLGMTTIAVTALSNITNKAVDAGLRMGKALTIDPIKAGFSNYETKINAVQTILSNTADQGTNLKQVTGQLNILNEYANLTVYNFSEMAKNIGTFTAAGVDLKTSVSSIKGIANLAALSGSTSEQASGAMYQLSQAIAAGQVHLQDWNSVVNAGIGGAVFQKNLIQSALATGTLDASQVHLGKTMADTTVNGVAFRQSLTPPPGGTSWLTSGVLTKSLGTFTGDLTKAQLVAQGFTKDQAKAILAQGNRAVDSATKIKTFTQLFQALKEEVASSWSAVFEALFGNINQAKKFLTPLHNLLNNAFTKPIYAIADALAAWRKAGGFDDISAIFKNLGTVVSNLLTPFKALFGAILPSTKNAGKGLEGFTHGLATFTGWLAKLTAPMTRFQSFFRYLGIRLKDAFKAFSPLLGIFKPFGQLLNQASDAVAAFGNHLINVGPSIVDGILGGLSGPEMKKGIEDFANNIIVWIKDTLGIHSPAATMVPVGIAIVQGIVQGLQNGATILLQGVQKLFTALGQFMREIVQNVNFDDVISALNTALHAGVLLVFANFVHQFGGVAKSFKSLVGSGKEVLEQLTNNLKTMQTKVKSEIIRNIAISVGILAVSALLLSTINPKKLALSLGAIAGMMATMFGVMAALGGGSSKGKHAAVPSPKTLAAQTARMVGLSTAMISFATSVLILSAAVALMGQLKPETIKKGLAGVAGVIGLIVSATAILSKTGGGATILATSTAMLVMAAALTAFVGVMKLYETLNWKTLIRGGGSAALVILAIGGAMRVFGKNGVTGAVGMVVAAAALKIMAGALADLAKIRFDHLLKAVIAMDFVMASMAVVATGMVEAGPGALAMLVMAGAMLVLAKSLDILAKIPFWDLVKAIGALVVVVALIAGASILLTPAIPLIAALGTALLLFGAAIALAGLGVLAFATGMGILAVIGPAAFAALADGIDTLLAELPKIGEAIGGFLVSILTGIAKAAEPLAKALTKLLGIMLDGLSSLIPKVKHLMQQLINAMIDVIVHSEAHAIKVFIQFLLAMLTAVDKSLPKFIRKGTNIIVSLIDGLSKAYVRIANATGKAILQFLNGLDKAVVKYAPQIRRAGLKLAYDMIDGLTGGLLSYGVSQVKAAAESIASHLPDWMKKVLHIKSPSRVMRDEVGKWAALGVAEGLDKHSKSVEKSAGDLANKSLAAMKATFRNSKNAANNLIDINPKITPVLDLSELERQSSKIGSVMGRHTVSADVSRRSARNIASDHAAKHGGNDSAHAGDTYNFTQVNNSPKPINHVAAYRGGKSQMALFREVTSK